jgi:hypothetical protein
MLKHGGVGLTVYSEMNRNLVQPWPSPGDLAATVTNRKSWPPEAWEQETEHSKPLRLFEMGVKPILTLFMSSSYGNTHKATSYSTPFSASFHDVFISDKSACFSRILSDSFFGKELSYLPDVLSMLPKGHQSRSATQKDWIEREVELTVREALLLLKEAYLAREVISAILKNEEKATWLERRKHVIEALIHVYNARCSALQGITKQLGNPVAVAAMYEYLISRLEALTTLLKGKLDDTTSADKSKYADISVASVPWNENYLLSLSESDAWKQAAETTKAEVNDVVKSWFPSESRWPGKVSSAVYIPTYLRSDLRLEGRRRLLVPCRQSRALRGQLSNQPNLTNYSSRK